jgi:hypothetical protein
MEVGMPSPLKRILIADAHPTMVAGVRQLLNPSLTRARLFSSIFNAYQTKTPIISAPDLEVP